MSLRIRPLAAVALIACTAAPLAAQKSAPIDLIVVNARVYTVDDATPTAQAFAVRAGRIAFVGTTADAMKLKGPSTKVIDAGGRPIIPGMTDAHAHLTGLGQALRIVDLTGTQTYDELIQRVVARAKTMPAGAWVTGRGWDQNAWPDKRFPTHDALSRALPDQPVVLTRVDGHAVFANARAMDAARVDATTKDPDGGRIERDASGKPTGVFVDNAMRLVTRVVPNPTRDDVREMTLLRSPSRIGGG